MTSEANWQKVECELYRISFRVEEMLRDPNLKKYNPGVRSALSDFGTVCRKAANMAHQHRAFTIVQEVYVQEMLPEVGDWWDEDGYHHNDGD